MATNPYSYGSLGTRWTVGEPTSKSLLDISRVKNDANRWTLEQLITDPDDSATLGFTLSFGSSEQRILQIHNTDISNYFQIYGGRAGSPTSDHLVFSTGTNGTIMEFDGANHWITFHDTAGVQKMYYRGDGSPGLILESGVFLTVGGLITASAGISGTTGTFSGAVTVNDTIRLDNGDTTVGGGDVFGDIEFYDNDGGSASAGVTARIQAVATGNYGASNILFSTSHSSGGARTALTERVKITSEGDFVVNTSQLFVDQSTSRVGINTASPVAALNVYGSNYSPASGGQAVDGLVFRGGTAGDGTYTNGLSFSYGGGSAAIAGVQNGADSDTMGMAFFTHSSGTGSAAAEETMRLTSAGLLGINETSPAYTLDVQAVGSSFNPARFSGYGSSIDTFIYADTAYWSFGDAASFGGNLWGGRKTVNELIAKTNGSRAMTIDSSQRVGIGTSSPTNALSVEKSISNDWIAEFKQQYTATGQSYGVQIAGGTNASDVALQVNNAAVSPLFYVKGNGEVVANGSVGIGTSSPRMNLTVKGNNSTAVGIGVDNDSGSGTLDISALGSTYNLHGANAGEVWFYSPDNINIGGATGNSNDIKFLGAGAERVRITSAGNLLVGRTGTAINSETGLVLFPAGYITHTHNNSGSPTFAQYNNRDGAGTNYIYFQTGATTRGSIVWTASSTSYNTTSDYRLKENVVGITDGITRIKSLKPSRFNFIENADRTVDGFVAHEVSDIVPEAISGVKDAVDDEGNPEYQGIDQSKLVPLLTAALQEAITKIETLETKVAALEAA